MVQIAVSLFLELLTYVEQGFVNGHVRRVPIHLPNCIVYFILSPNFEDLKDRTCSS